MLAHKLVRYGIGGRTVQELSDEMTVDEFLRWAAFSSLEPFGDDRNDWHFARLLEQTYNMNRGKSKASKPAKAFLLEFRQTGKEMSLQEMEMALMMRFAAMGGRFPEQKH
jgi:hypothetical protein